jgi:hypothetical protein
MVQNKFSTRLIKAKINKLKKSSSHRKVILGTVLGLFLLAIKEEILFI